MSLSRLYRTLSAEAPTRKKGAYVMRAGLLLAFVLTLTILLYAMASEDEIGADYELFRIVSLKALAGEPLYQQIRRSDSTTVTYLYPPHVAFMLAPLAILPLKAGWAIMCSLGILSVLLVGARWRFDFLKNILSLTALPAIFSLYQGNIDGFLMVSILLPAPWQLGLVLAKPQAIGGLALCALRHKSAWVVLSALVALALAFGYADALPYAREVQGLNVSLWHRLTPWQFIPGIALLVLGVARNDERILVLASPFMSPYVTLGSFWPSWVALCAMTNRFVLLALWALLWLGTGWGMLRLLI